MSVEHLATLDRMYKSRFSNALKHRFFELIYGLKFDKYREDGYLRTSEGGMLERWVSSLQPGAVVVEIGTFNGLSTSYLGRGAQRSGAKVFSVDPFQVDKQRQVRECDGSAYIPRKKGRDEVSRILSERGIDGEVELIEGFSVEVAREWNKKIDFLWIDGNHNQVAADYEAWRKHLVDGARVAFHDAHPKYGIQNVADFVREVVEKEKLENLEQVKSIISFILKL